MATTKWTCALSSSPQREHLRRDWNGGDMLAEEEEKEEKEEKILVDEDGEVDAGTKKEGIGTVLSSPQREHLWRDWYDGGQGGGGGGEEGKGGEGALWTFLASTIFFFFF